jgi:hypothetical protein
MENYGKHYGKIQNLRNTMENLVKWCEMRFSSCVCSPDLKQLSLAMFFDCESRLLKFGLESWAHWAPDGILETSLDWLVYLRSFFSDMDSDMYT